MTRMKILASLVLLSSCAFAQTINSQLTVHSSGSGYGTVTSSSDSVYCSSETCNATLLGETEVTLIATPRPGSTFEGWSGACTGTGMCTVTLAQSNSVTATFNTPSNLPLISHIVILAQENRSFDHYFGALRGYWATNGYPDQSFDGLPQFNPTAGAAPLKGPAPSNPGCDPTKPPPSDCIYDTAKPVTSFHLLTECIENPSPSWNEAHVDWNRFDQVGKYPAKLNGYVWTAAHDARYVKPAYVDVNGIRAMGYYNGSDLNYYYFMASKFATSDRWFQPTMSRTNINREYLIGGTSGGYTYPNGTDAVDTPQLKGPTIFEELQAAGVSWKIYVNPLGIGCAGPPYAASCLILHTYLPNFTFAQTVVAKFPQNIAPISQYFTDLTNGTLPAVALIEPASNAGLDEHPSVNDKYATNIQTGEKYVSSLINGLMTSSSWKSSVFILTFDENGGLYDHVPPQKTVSPDGIKPIDIPPGNVCSTVTGPTCDFVYTGYRVPLIVVSPYTKKNYVSHTVADYTAILKLIETRFNLPALTKRDAAQMDMTEFFNFTNPPWMTPPLTPIQNTNGACYLNKLP